MSSGIDALRRRINHMIDLVEQQQVDELANEFERQSDALANESLCRRFALITPDHTLPDDFSEQCQAIDQDIESRKTPGIRAAEQRFRQKYAAQLAGARDELIRRLQAMHDNSSSEDSAA